MKTKNKKRTIMLAIALLFCILPLLVLQNLKKPLADELETTVESESPPGEATQTDAEPANADHPFVDISDAILTWDEVEILYDPPAHQETRFPHIHDMYHGKFYTAGGSIIQATGYCIAIKANDYATHGFCYQHGVATDAYGTVLTKKDGHSVFSQDVYTKISKALMYAPWFTPSDVSKCWAKFTSDGSDSEHTKNDNAVVALTCSYYNGDNTGNFMSYGDGLYGNSPKSYVAFLEAKTYNNMYFLVDGVNNVQTNKTYGLSGNTTASKSEDGMMMSEVLTVNAPSDLTWNYLVKTNYKIRKYTKTDLTAYTDYTPGQTVSLSGGTKFRIYADPSLGNKSDPFNAGANTKPIVKLYCYVAAGGQDVVTAETGNSYLKFNIQWEGTSYVCLKKTSSNTSCTNNNPLYKLNDTKYQLFKTDGTAAKTVDGKDAILICDGNGNTNTLQMTTGDYVVKEINAGSGYIKDNTPIDITLSPAHTADNPLVINTTDAPVDDPVHIALTKTNDLSHKIQGAIYCIEYYPGVQTYNEADAKSKHTGTVSAWYLKTDANGIARFNSTYLATPVEGVIPASSAFYLSPDNTPTFPLGTVVVYEYLAPEGYLKSNTHYVYTVKQESPGSELAHLYEMKDGTEQIAGGIIEGNDRAPGYTDSPIPVNLTVQKKNANPTPAQGSTGDLNLEGAVFGLYVKRDVVDPATNSVSVPCLGFSSDTKLTHSDGSAVIDPTTGEEVFAKAGDGQPVAISNKTDANGVTVFENIKVAANADDYYVKEIVAPKDFYRDPNEYPVDLRDDRTDAQKQDVNYQAINKTFAIGNDAISQPIHVKKYAMEVDTQGKNKLNALNNAEFSVYLLSNLQGDTSSCIVTNADGSVSYNFNNYDFSNETAEIVTADGQRKLVTGADGEDGEVTSIDLMPGTYVVVETKAPKGYMPIDPVVVQLPKFRIDANGKILKDEFDNPKIYATYSVSPLDETIEQYLKINKKDSSTNGFVMHNNAKFTIWDISGADSARYTEDVKTFGKQMSQEKQTETGYETISEFTTNDDGYLLLYQPFVYGEYAIVEETAPVGYDKAPNIVFSVREDGIYIWADNAWRKASVYTSKTANATYEYWEVDMWDAPFSLDVAKTDYETGKWVPNAELTIYKALDREGHIAVDEEGNAVILTARDETGEMVPAVWSTTVGFKHFDVVPEGWYVIRETKTPSEAGYATRADLVVYVGNDEQIAPGGKMDITGDDTIYFSFSYNDDGVTIDNVATYEYNTKNGKVALYNKPITVEVSKINAATEEELPGAELTLYRYEEDGSETEIEKWTSTSAPHVIKHLKPGKYKLHENTIPLGFYATPNTIDFDVYDSEEIQKCTMVNHPIVVEFNKRSLNADSSVEGATLALYRKGDANYKAEGVKISNGTSEDTPSETPAEEPSDTSVKTPTEDVDSVDEDTVAPTATPDEAEPTPTATPDNAEESKIESFKDENGIEWFLAERWVTTSEPHKIVGLCPGEYRLIEEVTPYGYTTSQSIDFTITDQKAPENVYMFDEQIHLGLLIHKTGESLVRTEVAESEEGTYNKFIWEDTDLSGVSFEVYNEQEELVATMVTDKDGVARIDNLKWGKYKIREVVPAGMVDHHVVYTADYEWKQGLTDENILAKLEVYNESCNTQLNLFKAGEYPELVDGKYVYKQKMLGGALFGVYAAEDVYSYKGEVIAPKDTCVGYAITDDNGVACFNQKLVRGKYYYKELKTSGPEYVMDADVHEFTLVLDNSKVEVINLNETDPLVNKLAKGKVKVYKIAKETKVPLSGAEFDIYNSDDKVVGHLVTDSTGYAETDVLPYGKYYLKETKAPDTYQLTNKKFELQIVRDGETTIVTIENSSTPKLGTQQMILIVILAVIASTLMVFTFKKIRKRKA